MSTDILATAISGIDNKPSYYKFEINCEFIKNGEKSKDYFVIYSKKSLVGLNNHDELQSFLKLHFQTENIEILGYQCRLINNSTN